jgi:uncharacterized membrane protein YdbT with pleckstrin-like domain/RNA polymerase subunit RPABC4/transcription elongation factor Spt4
MALIKCSECGREISDKANSCPGCGNPIQTQKNAGIQGLLKENSEVKIMRQPAINATNGVVIDLVILGGIWFILKTTHVFDWYLPQITGIFLLVITLPRYLINLLQNNSITIEYDERQITIKRGLVMKSLATINYEYITNISIFRNLFDLLTGLSTLAIWTTSDFPDAKVFLKKKDAEWLKNFILNNRQRS